MRNDSKVSYKKKLKCAAAGCKMKNEFTVQWLRDYGTFWVGTDDFWRGVFMKNWIKIKICMNFHFYPIHDTNKILFSLFPQALKSFFTSTCNISFFIHHCNILLNSSSWKMNGNQRAEKYFCDLHLREKRIWRWW